MPNNNTPPQQQSSPLRGERGGLTISIITINLNNLDGLKKTVESVINQTYKNIEYIVIDGASTDGSAEYIEQMQEHFAYWISEPDKGIYNAMNKGIDHATGDYLLFLNSGDYLAADDVIEKFTSFNPYEDIVYGDIWLEQKDESKTLKKMPEKLDLISSLSFVITHQAIFHKKTLFDNNNRYDETYKIIADWVFYNREILFNNKTYNKIKLIITYYNMDGLSSDSDYLQQILSEKKKYITKFYCNKITDIIAEYNKIKSTYNGLMSSGTVKIALKISSILTRLRNLF